MPPRKTRFAAGARRNDGEIADIRKELAAGKRTPRLQCMPEQAKSTGSATRMFADVGSAAAVIVAVCSLVITLYEARMTREHQHFSVWPRIVETVSDSAKLYIRVVENDGLGPALQSAPIRCAWMESCSMSGTERSPRCSSRPAVAERQYSLFRRGSVLLPGARLQLLTIGPDTISHTLIAEEHRVLTTVCYCSLYNQCWIAQSDDPDPKQVHQCVEGSPDEFAK